MFDRAALPLIQTLVHVSFIHFDFVIFVLWLLSFTHVGESHDLKHYVAATLAQNVTNAYICF